jgi:hypothetical protein
MPFFSLSLSENQKMFSSGNVEMLLLPANAFFRQKDLAPLVRSKRSNNNRPSLSLSIYSKIIHKFQQRKRTYPTGVKNLSDMGICSKTLGKGATAKVKLLFSPDNKVFAVKQFTNKRQGKGHSHLSEDELANIHLSKLRQEFEIASSLHHGNIVKTFELAGSFDVEGREEMVWCVIMEYCTGVCFD